MTTLYRIRTVWSGFSGAPGYTNMYFGTTDPLAAGAATAAADVGTFFNSVKACVPNTVTLAIDPVVALIEDYNGNQTGELTLGTPPTIGLGSQTGSFAAPAGACVTWNTATFRDGRRIRGRTFLVPLGVNCFQADGTLVDAQRTVLNNAAAALAGGAAAFVVYARERQARAAYEPAKITAKTYLAGESAVVVSGNVKDKVAILRSRRD
jgi:hypothetical protein